MYRERGHILRISKSLKIEDARPFYTNTILIQPCLMWPRFIYSKNVNFRTICPPTKWLIFLEKSEYSIGEHVPGFPKSLITCLATKGARTLASHYCRDKKIFEQLNCFQTFISSLGFLYLTPLSHFYKRDRKSVRERECSFWQFFDNARNSNYYGIASSFGKN